MFQFLFLQRTQNHASTSNILSEQIHFYMSAADIWRKLTRGRPYGSLNFESAYSAYGVPLFFYLLLSFRIVRVYMQNVFFRKERETPYLKGKRVLHMRFSVICRICRIIFTLRFYFCRRDPENGVDFQSAGTQHNSLSSGFWGGQMLRQLQYLGLRSLRQLPVRK